MQDGTLKPTSERIDVIATELTHLRRLIADLDLLAQTDTKTLRLHIEELDPSAFLHQVAQSFMPLATADEVNIVTDIAPEFPPIQADYERLL